VIVTRTGDATVPGVPRPEWSLPEAQVLFRPRSRFVYPSSMSATEADELERLAFEAAKEGS
jgi:hypothetical protein